MKYYELDYYIKRVWRFCCQLVIWCCKTLYNQLVAK